MKILEKPKQSRPTCAMSLCTSSTAHFATRHLRRARRLACSLCRASSSRSFSLPTSNALAASAAMARRPLMASRKLGR